PPLPPLPADPPAPPVPPVPAFAPAPAVPPLPPLPAVPPLPALPVSSSSEPQLAAPSVKRRNTPITPSPRLIFMRIRLPAEGKRTQGSTCNKSRKNYHANQGHCPAARARSHARARRGEAER